MGHPSQTAVPVIVRVGDGAWLFPGEAFPRALSDDEDQVLTSFLAKPAMTLPELIDRSTVKHAARVVARLLSKYPALAGALRRPGGKGRGGYAARVKNDGPPLVHHRDTTVPRPAATGPLGFGYGPRRH
jgi:hypothetical protein